MNSEKLTGFHCWRVPQGKYDNKNYKHFLHVNMFQQTKMPKTGPSPKIWLKRLREYAQGSFQFERGQRPGKNSYWAKRLQAIERCPKHKNPGNQDALERPITCTCGFHGPRRPAQQVQTSSLGWQKIACSTKVSMTISLSFFRNVLLEEELFRPLPLVRLGWHLMR